MKVSAGAMKLLRECSAYMANKQNEAGSLDFPDFMRRTTPHFTYPTHFEAYLYSLDRAVREPIEITFSAPPRHGKTTITLEKAVHLMAKHPGLKVLYIAYGQDFANSKSREAQTYALGAGLTIQAGRAAVSEWMLSNGSTFTARGIGGQVTGKGFNLIILDDPHKNRAEAESALLRERVWTSFNADIYTRREPTGTSIVCMATRWHPDDLIGRLIRERNWRHINMPALTEDGVALAPHLYPAEELRKFQEQVGPYEWASLYQGQPRPRGASLFGDTHLYDELPKTGYRVSIGADFAYTKSTYADFNAAVVLYHAGGVSYVAEVVRQRSTVADFKPVLRTLHAKHGGTITAVLAATETGVAEFLKSPTNGTEGSLQVHVERAVVDKFTRAQPASAAWRAGKILVPSKGADWVGPFVSEVVDFTGLKDKHDDQVDALVGAFHPFANLRTEVLIGQKRVLPF